MLSSLPSETPFCQIAFNPALYQEFPLIALFSFAEPLLCAMPASTESARNEAGLNFLRIAYLDGSVPILPTGTSHAADVNVKEPVPVPLLLYHVPDPEVPLQVPSQITATQLPLPSMDVRTKCVPPKELPNIPLTYKPPQPSAFVVSLLPTNESLVMVRSHVLPKLSHSVMACVAVEKNSPAKSIPKVLCIVFITAPFEKNSSF